jgi:Ger(x)C family germination protein
MKGLKFILITLAALAAVSFYSSGIRREPVEKLSIASALGYDLEKSVKGVEIRSVAVSQYILRGNIESSKTIVTKGKTIEETREERQSRIDKRFLLGLEKVYVIGEEYARYGIRDIIDELFRDPDVKDSAMLCVCKGKAEDMVKLQMEGYPSSGDFIEGLIKYSREMNFFPENYKLIDAYLRLDAEGRNLVVPYIEIDKNTIRISGLALFKGEKMVHILPMRQVKTHNLLRESNIMGVLTLEKSSSDYLNFYGKSKRKVKCYKQGNNYKFIIDLKMAGEIVINNYEPQLINNLEKRKEVERLLEKNLEKEAKVFLEELKAEHMVDCLELGRVAAAKYGRETGADWNNIFTTSDIEVNVSIEIDRFGRGDY